VSKNIALSMSKKVKKELKVGKKYKANSVELLKNY
jgi:hypothetical protein